jgi:TPR repeat protein
MASFLATNCVGADARPRPATVGIGSFPISFTYAAAWFAHESDSKGKHLALMTYFQGKPGWHDKRTDFRSQVDENPATIDMSVGETPIHIELDSERSKAKILGSTVDLSHDNVFVVEFTDTRSPKVTPLGLQDLSFGPEDNPAIVLLRRNRAVRAGLLGRADSMTATDSSREATPEVVRMTEEGLQLMRTGTIEGDEKGFQLLSRAAATGYAKAQYRVGLCHESGRGVGKKDVAAANEWYRKAAVQGDVNAQYKLGHSYRVGRGVKVDLAEALSWYKKAALNGDLEALYNVGWMYAHGQGPAENHEAAFTWYSKAAEQGYAPAQLEVAQRLKSGQGAPHDATRSYSWLLVLGAQRDQLPTAIWDQIQPLMESLEAELKPKDKTKAEAAADAMLDQLSRRYVERLGR